jgi:type II secretory pathway pseudopilin PulG
VHLHGSATRRTGRRRPGVALVAALALLALAAALLAGSFASAVSFDRATRSAHASVHAEALARRAAAEALTTWQDASDSLAVHAFHDGDSTTSQAFGRTAIRTRVQRISARLYAITTDVRVGEGAVSLAHRRYRLVVERSTTSDSAGARGAPRPIARWAFAGIY